MNTINVTTFLFLFSNQMLVIRAGIHKILVRIGSREDPDQTASSNRMILVSCMFRTFWQATIVFEILEQLLAMHHSLFDMIMFFGMYQNAKNAHMSISLQALTTKTCLWEFADNKGPNQPAQMGSLISDFVIRLSESIISRLATSKISIF